MNLSTAGAVASASNALPVRLASPGQSSVHGGPVIRKR
jgi:hypothetical protein